MSKDPLILFFDFETFYSQTYSLTKMSPAEYILDPLFEAICLGVCSLGSDPMIIDGPEIPEFLERIQNIRRPKVIVSHNAQFDVSILTWRYGFVPDFIVDTIALSRTVLGPNLRSHSLDSVSRELGLAPKGSILKDVKGMGRADIMAAGLWTQFTDYCMHDAFLCREIYARLVGGISGDEHCLQDTLTRCTTEPLLRVDRQMLEDHLQDVVLQKELILASVAALGINKPDLMSNQKFADVLRNVGIEPPMKESPTTGSMTYAFAKSDKEFTDLLDHPNPMVRTVVEARLGTKSTIEETRTKRFIAISNLEFPNLGSCVMPMPVIIGAAHTHRVGGGWDLNVQNMGRGSKLRDAIHAQDNHLLLVADAKQIEARVTAWFCGQEDLLQQFRDGEDVYSIFASEIFERTITKDNKNERLVGKTGILQLGYASGWLKFQRTVALLSQGSVLLDDMMAMQIVNRYRAKYAEIKKMWKRLDSVLMSMHSYEANVTMDPGEVIRCIKFYCRLMIGPTNLPIHFPDLQLKEKREMVSDNEEIVTHDWWFRDGKFERRTYGASLLETIAQHIARCIVMSAAVRLRDPMHRIGARLVHTAHDELVYHVPEENVETAKIWASMEMNRPPTYAPDLPLDCDIGVAFRYGDAK